MTAGLRPRNLLRRSVPLDERRTAHLGQSARTLTLAAVYPAVLVGCLLAGFVLRLHLLDQFPLREDEAIYGYWARYGREVDWRFLQVWPDKPPLFIALLALAFEGWGASPAAGRLLSISASLLTIPVVAATARRWWGPVAGMAAAGTIAASPFAISFAPTIYTDSLLVLAGSLALCAAAYGRSGWAGLWLGAAIMTKQQGLLVAPLVIAVLLHALTQRRNEVKGAQKTPSAAAFFAPLRELLVFFAGLLLVVGPVMWWDSQRWAIAPSPWDLGARNVGALTWLAPAQWLPRLQDWAPQFWYLHASWLAWTLLPLLFTGAVWVTVTGRRRAAERSRSVAPAWLLLFWGLAFLAFHVIFTVQAWDRYLLPLAPVLALLTGWSVAALYAAWPPGRTRWLWAGVVAGLLILAPPASAASRGQLPIGGDHGAYAGLESALARVAPPISNLQSPISPNTNTVLYHRELGWQTRFYLYDELAAGRVDLRWFPSATYLADNAAKTPHLRRYLVEPDWAPMRDLAFQLAARQLRMETVLRTGHFTVYAITEQPHPVASDWRVCAPAAPWPVLILAQSVAP